MLTKDLLKYTVRAGRVYPKYIKPTDSLALDLAARTEQVFQDSLGMRVCDLHTRLASEGLSDNKTALAMIKLLEERTEKVEVDESVESQRWRTFDLSKKLRLETSFQERFSFQKNLAGQLNKGVEELQDELYADLPDQQRLKSLDLLGSEKLIHRLNCAQIQGLLLRAKYMDLHLEKASLVQRRALIQKLRFFSLWAEPREEYPFCIRVSGPMAIFDSSQAYGLRLANFFPYLLLVKDWKMEASLEISKKKLELQLDSSKMILSHYPDLSSYIPDEFGKFISNFGKEDKAQANWTLEVADTFINLGGGHFCFPDFKLTHRLSNEVVFVELFHRWHKGQLQRRLEACGGSSKLLLGVCSSLKASTLVKQCQARLIENGWNIFSFNGFPTAKKVLQSLDELNSC